MYTCTRCGATGISGFHKDPNNWREGKYICNDCYQKMQAANAKNAKIFCKLIAWPFKLAFKLICALARLLFSKWVLTVLTCGMSFLLWKGLDKIYSKH